MKETHFAPGGHPSTYPGEYEKLFQTLKVSDVTLTILNEKWNEIRKHKYERNTFRPWGTPKDPPWGAWKKLFETLNVSDVTLIILN